MLAYDETGEHEAAIRGAARSGRPWSYWRPPGEPGRLVSRLVTLPFSRGRRSAVPESSYRDRVRAGLRAIEAGYVEKVVLAREEVLPAADPAETLITLERNFPNCWVFAASNGRSTFLGATPELLARVRGRTLETCALAGTSLPGDESLLHREKDRREHLLVVDAIVEALRPLCEELDVASTPELMVLPNVQHLRTPIRGTLRVGFDATDVVEALHPTPAVCGTPREAALRLITELEPFDRGLYAGVVGFADGEDAEMVVALRSARLDSEATYAYAGAGIVAGSDPDAEDRETMSKLQAITDALRFR